MQGAWAGKGAKKQKNARKYVTKVAGVEASKRKDAQLNHVIISEKKDKKAAKYMLKDLPFPYTSAAQHEHKLATPLGPEWSTSTVRHRLLPRSQRLVVAPESSAAGSLGSPSPSGICTTREWRCATACMSALAAGLQMTRMLILHSSSPRPADPPRPDHSCRPGQARSHHPPCRPQAGVRRSVSTWSMSLGSPCCCKPFVRITASRFRGICRLVVLLART